MFLKIFDTILHSVQRRNGIRCYFPSFSHTAKIYTVAVMVSSLAISGCEKEKDETFLTIQMCLFDKSGVKKFKDIMRAAAKSENLQFIDGSKKTGAELKTIGADALANHDPALAINVGIKGDGGIIVMGGNLGLPPYQVALGFGQGSDPKQAHRLSDRLVHALSQHWSVETVPREKGVFPMTNCSNETQGMPKSPKSSTAR